MLITKLKYEVITSLSEFISFAFFIILLFWIFQSRSLELSENVFLSDLLNNWSKKPMQSIFKAEGNFECENELFTREWEGTESACDCRNSYHYGVKSDIFYGKCSFMQIVVGCREIGEEPSMIAKKWKGAKLCVNHLEMNFLDTVTIIGTKCPKKYILCGVDSKNFNLCFPKHIGCPVNKIKLTNSDKTPSEYQTTIQLNDDWFFHYSDLFTNNSILIDIKYSEGRVCINPSETNLKLNYLKYKKINDNYNFTIGTCTSRIGKFNFDERYSLLDSVSKFKFFQDNKIIQQIEKLPHLNSQDLINYNAYLYERSYIHWSPYCRSDKELSPEVIINDLSSLTLIDGLFNFAKFYFIIISLFHLIVIPLIEFLLSKYKYNNKLINYLNRFSFLLFFAFIQVIILLLFILNKYSYLSKKFVAQKCGDYTTNMIFNDIGKGMNELAITSYKILLFALCLFGVIVINKILKNQI